MFPCFSPLSHPSRIHVQTSHANEAVWLDMTTSEDDDMNSWCMAGYTLVARGQAAVLLVASECRVMGEGCQ